VSGIEAALAIILQEPKMSAFQCVARGPLEDKVYHIGHATQGRRSSKIRQLEDIDNIVAVEKQ
jgi:hypothetical protein